MLTYNGIELNSPNIVDALTEYYDNVIYTVVVVTAWIDQPSNEEPE